MGTRARAFFSLTACKKRCFKICYRLFKIIYLRGAALEVAAPAGNPARNRAAECAALCAQDIQPAAATRTAQQSTPKRQKSAKMPAFCLKNGAFYGIISIET